MLHHTRQCHITAPSMVPATAGRLGGGWQPARLLPCRVLVRLHIMPCIVCSWWQEHGIGSDTKRVRQRVDRHERHVAFAALDLSNVAPVSPRRQGEVFV